MQGKDIAIGKGERGLIGGRSGSGKSTLAWPALILGFLNKYPRSYTMIVDTKPRFRADVDLHGISAARHYKGMDHGVPVIPESVRLDLSHSDFGIKDAVSLGHRILILQTQGYDNENIMAAYAIDRFYKHARYSRPSLLYVDELLDFYTLNGQPKRYMPNSILRCVRAGREKGLASLLSTQRLKGIPIQVLSELSKLYLGALDVEDDMEHLESMGIPPDLNSPEDDRVFVFYDKRTRSWAPFRLTEDSVRKSLQPR
jgi:energy-coupling factor transporter ATP-binding protein EcfA2